MNTFIEDLLIWFQSTLEIPWTLKN